jgi:hypothetical protein
MNTQLPPEIDLALRKLVERAVRPVRAGKAKKLTMREELYAHLTAIYLEEVQQQADQQQALRSAFDRFGEPAALTAELNASVGWIERLDYWEEVLDRKLHAWFDYRTDEPWLRLALRWAAGWGLFNSFVFVLLLTVTIAQSRVGDSSGFGMLWRCSTLLTVTQPAALLGIRGVYMALRRRRTAFRWLEAALQSIIWTSIEVGVVLAFWWSITGSLPTNNPQMVGVLESFFIGLPPFLIFGGWLCSVSQRNQDKNAAWNSLAIDD